MQQLGKKIAQLRQTKEMSLQALAEACLLSEQQLEIIENGEVIPSLSVLIKICRSLDIPIGTLLDGLEEKSISITRKGERPETVSFSNNSSCLQHNHLKFYSMAPHKSNRNMEPFVICLEKSTEPQPASSHEGEEFIYVVEGEIQLTYGDTVSVIKAGDSVYYDSITPHSICSISENSKVIAVIYMPF